MEFVGIASLAFIVGFLTCRAFVRHHQRQYQKLVDSHAVEKAGPVEIGGVPQWVSIRGRDRRNPVLLFLHGGPGTVFSGISYSYQLPWEEYFTVVNWDQRGSGRSLVPGSKTVSLETLVQDSVELIEYLCEELKQEKVFLMGHSWGGFLGLLVAHRLPGRLHAFVGLAPLLGIRQVYREAHKVLTEAATAAGDSSELAKLEAAGLELPETVDDVFLSQLGGVLAMLPGYGMSWHNQTGKLSLVARILTLALFSPDLKLSQVLQPLGGSRAYAMGLFAEIADVYLPDSIGHRFDAPMVFAAGEYDHQASITLVKRYADQIEAPRTSFHELRGSAHAAVWEAPGQILDLLVREVLPLSKPG